jgi:acetyltransferase-like isoleucine patch superfamily enzyme
MGGERMRRLARELPRAIGYYRGPLLMSWLRKRWVLLRHPHADIRFEGHAYLGPGFSLHIPKSGTFIAGDGVEFRRGFRCELEDGRVSIGAGSVFTYDVLIQCSTSIEIGEGCIFAQSAILLDGNHRFRDLDRPILEQGYDVAPVRIGDGALISSKCTVMADVGERAVVGANAVVTRPVAAFTVSAGVPARPIEYFGPPEHAPLATPD